MAFLFFWMYALAMNKWKLGVLTFIVVIPLSLLFAMLVIPLPLVALIPIGVIFWFAKIYGQYGHVWKEEKLISHGYEHVDAIDAQTEAGAIAEYMRKVNI